MARSAAVRHLRTLFSTGTAGGMTDGALLERFVRGRDEAAFAVLVARHGPMVLGVCRRFLADDSHLAEDAFQATFLVLVKRAGSVRVDDSLGRWLYGVSCRVASRARVQALRRRVREGEALRVGDAAETEHESTGDADLRELLDAELGRLPEKYRAPVVLCYLEGLTHDRAARHLGWPVGTVRGRLARAREQLRIRLARRGLAALALGASSREALAVVPASLAERTVQLAVRTAAARGTAAVAVAALAHGAIRTAVLSKLKMTAAAVLAVGITVVAASASGPAFRADSGPAVAQAEAPPKPKSKPRSKTELEATRLAEEAFGKDHWAADPNLPVRYYYHKSGYWMYARTYERLNGGKQIRVQPFALVSKSRRSGALKTVEGSGATIDLDHPPDAGKSSPRKIVHMVIDGVVHFGDNGGTPHDKRDDVRFWTTEWVAYDEPQRRVWSESKVMSLRTSDLSLSGSGLEIELDEAGDLLEFKSLSILKNAHVVLNDTKAAFHGPADAEKRGDGAPVNLWVREGAMRVSLPGPDRPGEARFLGKVQVNRLMDKVSDQLTCDSLRVMLVPGLRPGSAQSLGEVQLTGCLIRTPDTAPVGAGAVKVLQAAEMTLRFDDDPEGGSTTIRVNSAGSIKTEPGPNTPPEIIMPAGTQDWKDSPFFRLTKARRKP